MSTRRRKNSRKSTSWDDKATSADKAWFAALMVMLAAVAGMFMLVVSHNSSVDRSLEKFHDEILAEIADMKQGETADDTISPPDSDKPTASSEKQDAASSQPGATDTAQAEVTPTQEAEEPRYTAQTEVTYHPETNDEMLAYLRTQGQDEEFLPMRARDLAWWTDGDDKIVDMLRPGRTYTAHFYFYALSLDDEALTGAFLGLTSALTHITGGLYAFPGETFELDGLSASIGFEGYVWTDFNLPTVSATDKALGITIDTDSFRVRQAYGAISWDISEEDAEAMLNGKCVSIGSAGPGGDFATSRENAIEFTFRATTSENELESPVMFIRGDGKIACYDYLETEIFDRWSFPDLSPSQCEKICEEGVYPAG